MSIRNALIALPFVVLAVPAFAQDVAIDAAIDTDGDSAYSLVELQVVHAEMTAEEFAAMDLNADGVLDLEEVAAATEAGLLMAAE